MKWITNFFNDLGGSLIGGRFYSTAVGYPTGRAWKFLLIFLFIVSLILTFHLMGLLSIQYEKAVVFLDANDYEVVFDNGVIANMPTNLKLVSFEGDTMAVWEWIRTWSDADSLKEIYPNISLFIGPSSVFSYSGVSPRSTKYPQGLTMTLNSEYLKNLKQGYSWIVSLVSFVIIYLLSIPWAFAAILIFIIPFLAIKFSKIGLKFGDMLRLGMYMVTFHFLYFLVTLVLNIEIPYGWALNFPLYIFIVILLVRINADDLESIKGPGIVDRLENTETP